MKRFALSLLTLAVASAVVPAASAAPDFDQLRRENLEKNAISLDELREENRNKSGKYDHFDELRRENLEKNAISSINQ